jgi:NAD+ diphosphatase
MQRNPNAFAHSPLDRAGHRRRDAAWLTEARAAQAARFAPFHQQRPFVVEHADALEAGWLAPNALGALGAGEAAMLFLGVDPCGAPHFAFEAPDAASFEALGRFDDLRAVGPRLPADDIAILGCAKSVFEWHVRHGFCANCGAATHSVEAGWKRLCPACGAEHFPRVDPVVIMVPVFGEKMLLGRQARWPRGMHSALAGFIEPGETIEEAVARETLEEAGLVVTDVRLHSSQPWPFPSSLMIGAICDVASEAVTVDHDELEAARWFTREEARALIAGKHPDAFSPPPFAIAHQLIKSWAAGD